MEITPQRIRSMLMEGNYSAALMLSFKLNEESLILEVVESIPISSAPNIIENLPDVYIDKLLSFCGHLIESSAHLEFYLHWLLPLLVTHGPKLKQRSQQIMPSLRTLQRNLARKYEDLQKISDHNKFSCQYLLALSQLKAKIEDRVLMPLEKSDDELPWREESSDESMEFEVS
ncbi:U3 snoRNP protein [Bulinus truncatus]|nr:U3 snoRNP protein [Bulinus truncatus]